MASSSKNDTKTGGTQAGTGKSNSNTPVEPFLSKMEGAGVLVRFNSDWAKKCARDLSIAMFVSLFEDNVMPSPEPVEIQFGVAGLSQETQDTLTVHLYKLHCTELARIAKIAQDLYQVYWMSLSTDWQTLLSNQEGFAEIKKKKNLAGIKNLLESTFGNPMGSDKASNESVERAMTVYHGSAQFEREGLSNYYKRFLQIVKQLEATVPKEMMPNEGMRVTRFLASLNKRDGVYYASLKKNAALVGNEDGYPTTLADALIKGARYLLQCKTDTSSSAETTTTNSNASASVYVAESATNAKKPADKSTAPEQPKVKKDLSTIQCFGCKLYGHYKSDCKAKSVNSLVILDSNTCAVCDVSAEWTDEDDRDVLDVNTATVRVKGDSCAEISIVGEGFPITNLAECEPLTVRGVGGSLQVALVGEFGPMKSVYYHPDIPVNIFSLGEMEKVAEVKYIQGKAFQVRFHDGSGEYVFSKRRDNTFACDVPINTIMCASVTEKGNTATVMNATVSEREKMYSKKDVERARGVRMLKHNLGGASNRDLIEFITNGVALNCPYTPADVHRAEKIYGPDIACLKGKMTSPGPERPLVVTLDHGEQRRQELHVDIFEVSGVSFALSVMVPMKYTFATYMPGKSAEEVTEAMSGLLRMIQSKGFVVDKMIVDPEGGLAALQDTLPMEVVVNAPGTHVPRAERRGRTVKERMRTIISALPFRLSVRFVKFLVFFIATRLNLIPQSTDGARISPRERFTGKKVVYTKDLELCFGDGVQIFTKPEQLNGMEERCKSAIALYPSNNEQGSWKFYKFSNGQVVTAAKWTKTPLQDLQIKTLNDMADADVADLGRGKRAKISVSRVRTAPGEIPLERMIVNPALQAASAEPSDGTQVGPVAPQIAMQELPVLVPDVEVENTPVIEVDVEHGVTEDPVDGIAAAEEVEKGDDDGDEDEDELLLGSRWEADGTRRSLRQARPSPRVAGVFKLSVGEAIEKYGELAERATLDEFSQMKMKRVLDLVHYADLTAAQRERIIHSSLFLKEKYDEEGVLERIKARLVASGNQMDREIYGSGSSPTVATEAVAIMLAQSAAYNETRFFVDIGTAFLEATMAGEEVFMYISKSLAQFMVQVMPEAADFIDSKGRILVRLLKALYGCIQSSRLWYEHLRDILLRGGYRANDYDCCVFHKGSIGNQCTASLHVDDLFVSASTPELGEELLDLLRASLHEVKVKQGRVNSYLGMRIVETDTHLEVDMEAYTRDCVAWSGAVGFAKTPADAELFEIDEDAERVDSGAQERFHTGTAKLLHLAKRTRPGIMTPISFLCARVGVATQQDERKLDRVFRFLNRTADQVIKFVKGTRQMDVFAFIDAGYGVHHTGESRSGLAITINGTAVLCKTARQKIVTKSSTEAELVALSDGLTEVIWVREFLQSAGHELPPTRIGEDNQSVLALLEARRFGTARTKHISVRYFFICDRIAKGELSMVYVPTAEQLADILSKALMGRQFEVLHRRLHGDLSE